MTASALALMTAAGAAVMLGQALLTDAGLAVRRRLGAGVTGLIKASLALKNRLLPPSLNFTQSSPDIDLATDSLGFRTPNSALVAAGYVTERGHVEAQFAEGWDHPELRGAIQWRARTGELRPVSLGVVSLKPDVKSNCP